MTAPMKASAGTVRRCCVASTTGRRTGPWRRRKHFCAAPTTPLFCTTPRTDRSPIHIHRQKYGYDNHNTSIILSTDDQPFFCRLQVMSIVIPITSTCSEECDAGPFDGLCWSLLQLSGEYTKIVHTSDRKWFGLECEN